MSASERAHDRDEERRPLDEAGEAGVREQL
jgi:hypothetical protein